MCKKEGFREKIHGRLFPTPPLTDARGIEFGSSLTFEYDESVVNHKKL